MSFESELAELHLEHYVQSFQHAGIQSWQSLSTITEAELIAIGVRVGHRRKIQRAVARKSLWPENRPLPSPEQLQQHRQNLQRLARGTINSDLLEENYYSLTSSTQSKCERATFSNDTVSHSSDEDDQGTTVREVLRCSSRLFPLAMNAEDITKKEQDKLSRVLCGLETLGVPISEHFSSAEWLNDVTRRDPAFFNVTAVKGHSHLNVSSIGKRHTEDVHTQQLETFFEAFLQTFNHYVFVFSESELRQSFRPYEHVSDGDFPIHIYLVLALGAKASGLQVEDIQNELYIKARLRLLSEESNTDLGMMRILVLICLFEIDDHVDVSYRFLNAASSIGLARGFDREGALDGIEEDPSGSQSLRLWETIRFLNLWFLLQNQEVGIQLSDTSHFLDIEHPPLLSEHCVNGRLVQMSINSIGNLLRELIKDRLDSRNNPHFSRLYKAHLEALESWHTELPPYLRLQTPTAEDSHMVKEEVTRQQQTAILNVQSLFLGIVIELLQPAVALVLQELPSSSENGLLVYARRCVQSSTILIRLCDEMDASGVSLSSSWIAQHFLFKATLVLIADTQRTNPGLEEFVSAAERLSCIQIAQNLLNQVSLQARVIQKLCEPNNIPDALKAD